MSDPGLMDQPAAISRADPADVLGSVARLPGGVAEGWHAGLALDLPWPAPRSVAVLGVGDPAVAGALVRALWDDRLTVPLGVVPGPRLPAWVGTETLVVAISHSGSTSETLGALETALSRRCPVVCLTAGGALQRVARAARLPLAGPASARDARSAAGWAFGALAGLLARLGLLAVSDAEIDAAVGAATATAEGSAPAVPTAGNPAKRLAWSLVDRSVVVVGASWLAPVAWRWKQLLNTVAKSAASFESLPQAAHDAIAGFEQPDSLRDHKAVLMLRSDQEPPGDTRRAELFAEVLGTAGIWHAFVDVPGATPLDGVLSGWVLGAFVSAYLALLYGVDPASDEAIEYVRQGLTVADEPGAE